MTDNGHANVDKNGRPDTTHEARHRAVDAEDPALSTTHHDRHSAADATVAPDPIAEFSDHPVDTAPQRPIPRVVAAAFAGVLGWLIVRRRQS